MRNFNYPYFSQSLTEFWRRWHISLSTWFRDYVYLPLGGSRVSPTRRFANMMITFLVSPLGGILAGRAHDVTGSYATAYTGLLALTSLATLLLLGLRDERRPSQ